MKTDINIIFTQLAVVSWCGIPQSPPFNQRSKENRHGCEKDPYARRRPAHYRLGGLSRRSPRMAVNRSAP